MKSQSFAAIILVASAAAAPTRVARQSGFEVGLQIRNINLSFQRAGTADGTPICIVEREPLEEFIIIEGTDDIQCSVYDRDARIIAAGNGQQIFKKGMNLFLDPAKESFAVACSKGNNPIQVPPSAAQGGCPEPPPPPPQQTQPSAPPPPAATGVVGVLFAFDPADTSGTSRVPLDNSAFPVGTGFDQTGVTRIELRSGGEATCTAFLDREGTQQVTGVTHNPFSRQSDFITNEPVKVLSVRCVPGNTPPPAAPSPAPAPAPAPPAGPIEVNIPNVGIRWEFAVEFSVGRTAYLDRLTPTDFPQRISAAAIVNNNGHPNVRCQAFSDPAGSIKVGPEFGELGDLATDTTPINGDVRSVFCRSG